MGDCFRLKRPRGKKFLYSYSSSNYRVIDNVMFGGIPYTLMELRSSGKLTVNREIEADVWLCGGGGKGNVGDDGSTNDNMASGGGGGSGYAAQRSIILSGETVATIGSASGSTSFGSISAKGAAIPESDSSSFLCNGNDGGAGGGAGAYYYMTDKMNDNGYYIGYTTSGGYGDGSGESIVLGTPFGATVNDYNFGSSLGSGGGGAQYFGDESWHGGDGSSYGGDGDWATKASSSYSASGGKGAGGGGDGGASRGYTAINGKDATWYGCGGGGGGYWGQSGNPKGAAGYGYQGVIYIRWKMKDAIAR